MKILFAPSGKRMIPYPPVAPAVLAAALRNEGITAKAIDLEIEAWLIAQSGEFWPQNRDLIDPFLICKSNRWSSEIVSFADSVASLAGYTPGESIAISTMGYEQLAATLALAILALENGSRVILGGQFWTEKTARTVLGLIANPELTIVTNDGYEAIVQWSKSNAIPMNGFRWQDGDVVSGTRKAALTTPPIPQYTDANWDAYDTYAAKVLGATGTAKRAHLYVWDKQCPYKCRFCRVSSGSNVKLSSPESVAASMAHLLSLDVRQLNFMTNELNPTLSYMRRFIRALSSSLPQENDLAWFTYLRPDYIEAADFADLRRLGCRLVRYGVETGSQRLSDMMRKDYKIEIIEEVLKCACDAGILNHANFLVGYPGETEEDVGETLRFIDRVAPHLHSVRLNAFYLPPDSPMAKAPEESGIYLKEFKSGYWDFDMMEGSKPEVTVIEDRLERISERVKGHGIGFAGVLPFETLDFLARYDDRDRALVEMRQTRPYMWESSSSEWLKGQIGSYEAPREWRASVYQRGKHYSLALCGD